jgi:hypothetical protein
MWESYKEQEEFGKDVLKQFQNHLSKIPLPSIKQVHINMVVCTPHDFFDATGSIFPPELGNQRN